MMRLVCLLVLCGCARGQCPWSRELVSLHEDCVCAYGSAGRLSVQCSPVDFRLLVDTLRSALPNTPLDLLHVANGSLEALGRGALRGLRVRELHLARSGLRSVEAGAFDGLEGELQGLSLQGNALEEVPVAALREMAALRTLDLSHNRLGRVPPDAFRGLSLGTLKLSDNPHLNLSSTAFGGLEGSLKSLNLQSCGLTSLPPAVRRLRLLALLDLAQNGIGGLGPGGLLAEMHSLTALNLERNRIRELGPGAFQGVEDTLSSLSLLNNLLQELPDIDSLTEIRVLDLGFNEIKELPRDAFKKNKYLTLLALDGNPLPTIPEEAFQHLNSTLRGLSLGGASLQCDCRLRWVLEWVRVRQLQVSSRERSPQFCGAPEHLRRRTFASLTPEDLACDPAKRPRRLPLDAQGVKKSDPPSAAVAVPPPIRIKHAYKQDSTLFLEWEARGEAKRGYQVVIRMFGSQNLKRVIPAVGPRMEVDELPLAQCIVVCVIEYQDPTTIQAEALPSRQCRELKGEAGPIVSLDKAVIAASAVICAAVLVGALGTIAFCARRRKRRRRHRAAAPVRPVPLEADWETLTWNSGPALCPMAKLHAGCDNESFSPKPVVPKVRRSRSLTRPSRLASSSTDSDWNERSLWGDNDVDIYVSQHHVVSGRRQHSVR